MLNIINLLEAPIADLCVSNLVEYNKLVAITLDPVIEEIVLFHYLTKVGKSSKKKLAKKNKKVVALSCYSLSVSTIGFKSSEDLFHASFIVDIPVPDNDKIEQIEDNELF